MPPKSSKLTRAERLFGSARGPWLMCRLATIANVTVPAFGGSHHATLGRMEPQAPNRRLRSMATRIVLVAGMAAGILTLAACSSGSVSDELRLVEVVDGRA
jgi:hypothetical protein